LNSAVLAINPFVLGEVRSGRVRAKWGEAKIASAEKALAAYLLVPLDFDVLDAYVDVRARFLSQMGDNDMWIAATAKARQWPLATCDLDFCRLKSEIDLIYLPRDTDAPTECP
jgi:predicted nucleic acid-binding protein